MYVYQPETKNNRRIIYYIRLSIEYTPILACCWGKLPESFAVAAAPELLKSRPTFIKQFTIISWLRHIELRYDSYQKENRRGTCIYCAWAYLPARDPQRRQLRNVLLSPGSTLQNLRHKPPGGRLRQQLCPTPELCDMMLFLIHRRWCAQETLRPTPKGILSQTLTSYIVTFIHAILGANVLSSVRDTALFYVKVTSTLFDLQPARRFVCKTLMQQAIR
jgi:hypothetical protein